MPRPVLPLRTAGSLVFAAMLASIGACDVDVVARPGGAVARNPSGPPRADARPLPPEPGPCDDEPEDRDDDADDDADDDGWYGCPGNPCAHGWCFVGKCVGDEVGRDGTLLDPGVCCVDGECLEGDP
jgi:hypothetical protein